MNQELARLFEEDRSDARTFRGVEAFIASQGRRSRVEALLKTGKLQTAEDYFHAAFVFQHGDSLEYWAQAHLLARTAADLGYPKARYQAAAAYDRWLMRQGRPQKYGTQSVGEDGKVRVWDYDPGTTDEERLAWDVPILIELLERVRPLNENLSLKDHPDSLITTAQLQGLHLYISELTTSLASSNPPPPYGIPVYQPLGSTGPRPAYLPADLSLWQFGSLFCAKDRQGAVVCSWHPCLWQIQADSNLSISPETLSPETLFAQLKQNPQWMSHEKAFWHRLGIATSPTQCWLVGGSFSPDDLVKIAQTL